MKAKEYKTHYVGHVKGAIDQLRLDFLSTVEFLQSRPKNWNYTLFQNTVTQFKEKFDAVNRHLGGILEKKHWDYLYAAVVAPTKEELFGDELRKKAQERKERDSWRHGWAGEFHYQYTRRIYEEAFFRLFGGLLNAQPTRIPKYFTLLGIPVDCNDAETVKASFRTLAMQHHPDKGGSEEKMRELIEAKNYCLAACS